ncbi:hypothetical protein DRQ50_10700 [bacterium]|nr:MAG: hypothetical protein DRQ50_10700 [bacterium]
MLSVFIGGTLPTSLELDNNYPVHTPDRWFVSPAELSDDSDFGSSVGFMDDQDGDGRDDIFVGAPGMLNPEGVMAGIIYGYNLVESDVITVTNLTQAIPYYTSDASVTFTVRAVHNGGLPLTVTMNAPAFGVTDVEMIHGGGGTYTHTITYPDVPLGAYQAQYFVVSPWDNTTGGDGSFTLFETEIAVMDNNAVYAAPNNPATDTGLQYNGTPYSSVGWDFDDDRTKDLFISISDFESKLYRGDYITPEGIPHFVEWPDQGFAGGLPQPDLRGVTVGDLDRSDGKSDLFAAHSTDSRLYRWDEATSKVVNLAPGTGADAFNNVIAGTWGDLDGDGHLDLFLSRADGYTEDPPNYMMAKTSPASLVLTNADDGTGGREFVPTPSSGLPQNLHSTNASWADYDQDGDPDLFVGSLFATEVGASRLYRNDGGTLSDQTAALLGSDLLTWVVACSWHDMNNDGRLDLVLARHGLKAAVFYATADGGFDDGNGGAGPAVFGSDHGFSGMVVYDYNNDGRLDYLGLSSDDGRPAELYVNSGTAAGPVFTLLDAQAGLSDQGFVHGAVAADFGGAGGTMDGLADLYLGRPATSDAFYFKSESYAASVPTHHWVGVRIAGPAGQFTSPVTGATVRLEGSSHTQIQQIDGGSFRGGQSPSELIFGLGTSKLPVTVAVTWPNGETYSGIPVTLNRFNDITYDDLDIIESTVSATYQLQIGGKVDWIFTWQTSASVPLTVNRVHFALVATPYPCTPESHLIDDSYFDVTTTCTEIATGQYETVVRWSDRDCFPRCTIPFMVESGTPGQSVLSELHILTVGICAGF